MLVLTSHGMVLKWWLTPPPPEQEQDFVGSKKEGLSRVGANRSGTEIKAEISQVVYVQTTYHSNLSCTRSLLLRAL
jgi:hypothetical protein